MQMWRRSLIAAAVLIIVALPASGDKRKENIDIILAVDKSLSMAEGQKMDSVKRYINTWLMDEVLIPGDTLVVILFYGKAEVAVSQRVSGDADKQRIKTLIQGIRGNGRFTDIGNALDVMKLQLEKYTADGKKKFMLLMTDGKQEAPPNSKYYSPDGTFNHEFLANTKTIQKTGWKVQILGIGTETAAKELAKELQGSYGEITDKLSPENLKEQTENLLGSVSLAGDAKVAPVLPGGASSVTLTLKTEGFTKDARVSLSAIDAKVNGRDVGNVLPSPRDISVAPSGTTSVRVPLKFPGDLPSGTSAGSLSFSFRAGERFSPSEVSITLTTRGIVEAYWWMGLIGIAVLAGLVVVVIILVRRGGGAGQVRFVVSVDDEPLAGGPHALRSGGELFLNEIEGVFSLVVHRNARSIARLHAMGTGLALDVVKADRFPKLTEPAENVMGMRLAFRSENGKKRELSFDPPAGRSAAPAGAVETRQEKPGPAAPAPRRAASPAKQKKTRAPARKPRRSR